jgi:hypothetical protein
MPEAAAVARANRDFLGRAVRNLAADAGITQFLDLGTGLPTQGTCTRSPGRSRRTRGWSTWTTTITSRVVHTEGSAGRQFFAGISELLAWAAASPSLRRVQPP